MTTSKFAKTKYLIGVVKTVIHESGDQGCLSNWNEKKKRFTQLTHYIGFSGNSFTENCNYIQWEISVMVLLTIMKK